VALYELEEGSSRKFYRIELVGTRVELSWGRIGSAGQRKVIEHDTEAEARREYDAQIWKRREHGYRLVVDESKPHDPEAARAKINEEKLTRAAPLTKNARFHFIHPKKRISVWLEVRGSALVRGDDDRDPITTTYASAAEATRARDSATAKLIAEGFRMDAFGKK
jgi:predicted DNA-binding WGR domain protein